MYRYMVNTVFTLIDINLFYYEDRYMNGYL
jgi:hypothetical protein